MTLKRGSLHRDSNTHFDFPHRRHYRYTEITGTEQLGDAKGSKRRKKMKGQSEAAREVPQFNLWFFASTISYILRKAKAFYNECCCDAYNDQKQKMRRKVEVTLVDPYFSVPSFSCTTFANCM